VIWGKLEKLKIKSYTSAKRRGGTTNIFTYSSSKGFGFMSKTSQGYREMEVMFNPDSYSLTYENEFKQPKEINGGGPTTRYSYTKPQTLSLDFLIDDTSATAGVLTGRKTIRQRVEKFLALTCEVDGKIHEPRYLRLEWGDLKFDCRLKSVDINYTLFNRSGIPIRAELKAEFISDTESQKQAEKKDLQSPDLTHDLEVSEGDTLPLMTYQAYHDSSHYIKVAQANKINNFRRLKAQSKLSFPPIKTD